MRKICVIIILVLLTVAVFAQSPQKMSYQAVIRNSSNQLVTNNAIGIKISILQGSSTGTIVYTETQTPTTNSNGLLNIEIGGGAGFSSIGWANGPYFIKTETDPTGGTNYTIIGTSQLLSVPYALHSKTAETFSGSITETDPVFTLWDKSTGILITESQISDLKDYATKNMNNKNITNLANPINAQDAATKAYVDERTNFSVSKTGDTLYLGQNRFVIINGISANNNGVGVITQVPDITWTQVTVGASSLFTDWVYVAFGNNTFIAVTDNNCASTNNSSYVSTNYGLSWTSSATPGSTDISGIAFVPLNNNFVISHRCYEFTRNYSYSTNNGSTWTPITHSPNVYRYNLIRAKDYLFSNLYNSCCDRSSDGINWTNLTFSGSKTTSVMTYSEKFGLYYANDGVNFWTSSDANTWTVRDTLGQYQFIAGNNVVLAYKIYTAVPFLKKAVDGFTFNEINSLPNISYIYRVRFINGLFWAIVSVTGDDSKKVMVSYDGSDWKFLDTPSIAGRANDIEIGYDSNLKKNIIILPCNGGTFIRGKYDAN